jgi:hypothetical protein
VGKRLVKRKEKQRRLEIEKQRRADWEGRERAEGERGGDLSLLAVSDIETVVNTVPII